MERILLFRRYVMRSIKRSHILPGLAALALLAPELAHARPFGPMLDAPQPQERRWSWDVRYERDLRVQTLPDIVAPVAVNAALEGAFDGLVADEAKVTAARRGDGVDALEIGEVIGRRATHVPTDLSALKRSAPAPGRGTRMAHRRQIADAVRTYQSSVNVCARLSTLLNRINARTKVRFKVGRSGKPKNIVVHSRGWRNRSLERCIALKVSDWILPPGRTVAMRYELTFDDDDRATLTRR